MPEKTSPTTTSEVQDEKQLTPEAIVQLAVKEGIKAYQQEHDRTVAENSRRRLHNTKLLLKNYRSLKAHNERAIQDFAGECDETALAILEAMNSRDKDSLTIQSIKSSVMRTRTILRHIDNMLDTLRYQLCKSPKEEGSRRWDVLNRMYISNERATAEALAQKHNIDKRTVYKDIDFAVLQLSTLLFGIDGVRAAK